MRRSPPTVERSGEGLSLSRKFFKKLCTKWRFRRFLVHRLCDRPMSAKVARNLSLDYNAGTSMYPIIVCVEIFRVFELHKEEVRKSENQSTGSRAEIRFLGGLASPFFYPPLRRRGVFKISSQRWREVRVWRTEVPTRVCG